MTPPFGPSGYFSTPSPDPVRGGSSDWLSIAHCFGSHLPSKNDLGSRLHLSLHPQLEFLNGDQEKDLAVQTVSPKLADHRALLLKTITDQFLKAANSAHNSNCTSTFH